MTFTAIRNKATTLLKFSVRYMSEAARTRSSGSAQARVNRIYNEMNGIKVNMEQLAKRQNVLQLELDKLLAEKKQLDSIGVTASSSSYSPR